MFKGLAKLKAAKEKGKKEKSEHEGHATNKHVKGNISKEKTKARISKKKKGHGASSVGDMSQSSEEGSRTDSQTVFEDHSDVHRLRGKKRISKACEEAVNNAVSDFFECAWMSCAERFFITTAPVTVSFELRNTWLRIVEAEWQDPDMREKPNVNTKHNRIFKRDEPPLPLAFDSWSRGALEPLPRYRRESIMDPFIRDLDVIGHLPFVQRVSSIDSSPPAEDELELQDLFISPDGELQGETIKSIMDETELVPDTPSLENIHENDKWNFDLDQDPTLTSNNALEVEDSENNSVQVEVSSQLDSDYKSPPDFQVSNELEKKYIRTVLSARHHSLLESTTDMDYSSSPNSSGKPFSMRTKRKSLNTSGIQRFSPSQCGGRNGSGVFRLPQETTSEALLGRKKTEDNVRNDGPQIVGDDAVEDEGIVKVTKRGLMSQKFNDEEDELEVQPLFEEEGTPRKTGASDSTHRFQVNAIRRPSYVESHVKGRGLTLDETASEINRRFLKRRMVNLHGRFKRQTMRNLAARARQTERNRALSSSDRVTADLSKSSLFSSSIRTNPTRNKGEKNPGKRPSYSTSTVNISKAASTYSLGGRPVAKLVASEPQLNKLGAKKGYQQGPQQQLNRSGMKRDYPPQAQRHLSMGRVGSNKEKDNFIFNTMGNVRASDISYRNTAGKFQDMNRYPTQLESRYENMKRFSKNQSSDQTLHDTPSDCLTPSACSRNASPPHR